MGVGMAEVIARTLPSGVVLARDESIRSSGEFLTSNLFFFVKLKLALTNKRLVGEKPNTFLGLIPVGSEKVSFPLSNIAGVSINTRVAVLPLVLGLLLAVAGLAQGFQNGWLTVLIGTALLVASYQAQLSVTNSGGGVLGFKISVFNKGTAQAFASDINNALAERA